MKKSVYKPGTILAALLLLVLPLAGEEISKEFSKEYKANEGTSLKISNKYGDIIIETAQTDQITISAKVTLRYPNQEKAEKLLSMINVEFSEDGNSFEARTTIDESFSFTGWGGESRKFSINYKVQIPENIDLTVFNRYGNINIGNMSGFLKTDIKYGNLDLSKLSRDAKPYNSISIAYGNATIEEASWLDLTARYSENITIKKVQALLLDAKYCNLNLGTVSSLVGETNYKNLKIDNIDNLVLDAGYTQVNIGSLNKILRTDLGYGSFQIESIPGDFTELDVNTRYADISLGIVGSASYNLDARLNYGGLKYDEENIQVKRRVRENTSTEVSGIVGKSAAPASAVKISGSYAQVKLF